MFASFLSGSSPANSESLQEFGERSVKREETDPVPVLQHHGYSSAARIDDPAPVPHPGGRPYTAAAPPLPENPMQRNMAGENCSNLARQSSSPAGFFASFSPENVLGNAGSYRDCSNGANGEATPSGMGMASSISFSSGGKRHHVPSFLNDSGDDSSINGAKRHLSSLESQEGNSSIRPAGLTHHLSLPKTSSDMVAMEKFLHFQSSVPCQIRAKRGFATHPRSIAERVRRNRISERMRKLQELFPSIDKQTSTADMLDMAVKYIKDLQKQVKTLTDSRAKCTCLNEGMEYSNASA